ncbi:MAG: M6 family metalloprotease domain-containing protein [Candidatus Eisenbacteria bacterium]
MIAGFLFLFALPGGGSAGAAKPIPVSCLYPRRPADPETGKRGAAASETALLPALTERTRGAAPDSMAAVVVLLDWTDQEARRIENPPSRFEKEFFHTSALRNETTRDYYSEVSGGRFRIGGSVTVWLRSSLPYGYYVNGDGVPGTKDDFGFDVSNEAFAAEPYPANVWGIVREAVVLADGAGVDFSLFDSDGPDGMPSSGDDDGIVDALIVIHAGAGAERVFDPYLGPSQIWSHKSDLNDPAILGLMGPTILDGVRIGPYNMDPEIGQTGVYAHEFGHLLGLPDLYRTYAENGTATQESTVGVYCLMDAGSLLPYRPSGSAPAGDSPAHINPFFKQWLGWLEPEGYEAGSSFAGPVAIRLDEVERGGTVVRLLSNPGGIDWDGKGAGSGEYFLLENRRRVGFDEHLPGSGLLIWHVSERRPANESSDYSKRLLGVVETDGAPGDLGSTTPQGSLNLGEEEDFWPFGSRNDWTDESSPPSDLHGGAYSGIAVTEIREEGAIVAFFLDLESVRKGEPYAYPNPFTPAKDERATIAFRLSDANHAEEAAVRLYDLGGVLVRTLERRGDEVVVDGEGVQAYWDGRNDGGEEAASGVYLYVIAGAGEAGPGRIALLR